VIIVAGLWMTVVVARRWQAAVAVARRSRAAGAVARRWRAAVAVARRGWAAVAVARRWPAAVFVARGWRVAVVGGWVRGHRSVAVLHVDHRSAHRAERASCFALGSRSCSGPARSLPAEAGSSSPASCAPAQSQLRASPRQRPRHRLRTLPRPPRSRPQPCVWTPQNHGAAPRSFGLPSHCGGVAQQGATREGGNLGRMV